MKLLLLDPDEYYHHQFEQKLAGEFELVFAKDLSSGKQLVAQFRPDLVVSELLLADGPAFDLLSSLRSPEQGRGVPVIVFTQSPALEDIQETLGLGVSGYFVKGRDSINDVYQLVLALNQ